MGLAGSSRTRLGALAVAVLGATGHAGAQATFQGLGYLPGGYHSWAVAVSDDGTVVVGVAGNPLVPGADSAFRWSQTSGMTNLGPLLGNGQYSAALDVSADGSVMVGFALSPNENAFMLSGAGPATLLPLPTGQFAAQAYGVSADGLVVVGRSWGYLGYGDFALRWTTGGVLNLGFLPGARWPQPGRSRGTGAQSSASVAVCPAESSVRSGGARI